MTSHTETRLLPYSADQMFDLVADMARYPEFLPWCTAARVRPLGQEDGAEVSEVELVISFKVFRERYTSRVRAWRDRKRIHSAYVRGPFRQLDSEWRFRDVEGGSEVTFSIDFEFRSAVLQRVMGLVFHEAMQRIVRAFEARAAVLYGPGGSGAAAAGHST